MLTLKMLLDFILVCSVQFSTFLNVPELWRACLFNHNCLFFETRLWNSNLNGLNFAEFSHVFHHVRSSHMIQSPISGSSRTNKTRLPSLISLTGKTVLKWVLLTFMVFNSEPIMKIKSLSWMNSISFLRNSNSMTHLFIILFHLKDFFAKNSVAIFWFPRDRTILPIIRSWRYRTIQSWSMIL